MQQPPLRASVRRKHACTQSTPPAHFCAHAHGEGGTRAIPSCGRSKGGSEAAIVVSAVGPCEREWCVFPAAPCRAARARVRRSLPLHADVGEACMPLGAAVRGMRCATYPARWTTVRRDRTCLLGWRGRAWRAHDERRGRGDLGCRTRLCAGARREQRRQVRNLIPKGGILLGQLVDPRRLLGIA